MSITQRQRIEVLKARAISDEVANYRDAKRRARYVSFDGSHAYADIIRKHHTHPKGWDARLAVLSPGLIVNRWGFTGDDLPSYIRFDETLWTRKKPYHPTSPCLGFTHVDQHADGNPKTHRHGRRYTYPSKKDVGEFVKVVDVHPLAMPLLLEDPTPPIYFCLEGCFKADALLSAGKAAISVPSVTLWQAADEHIKPLLAILRKAPVVFVIPDSDYLRKGKLADGQPVWTNPKVRVQTDKAARWLRNRVVNVRVLVPPFLPRDLARGLGVSDDDRFKQGIDDHLAHDGNFSPWRKEGNPLGLHTVPWTPRQVRLEMPTKGSGAHKTREHLERVIQLIEWLGAVHHGGTGVFQVKDVRAKFGWGVNAAHRVLETAKDRGLLLYWPGRPVYDEELDDYYNAPHSFFFKLAEQKGYCHRCGMILDGHVPGSSRCEKRIVELSKL